MKLTTFVENFHKISNEIDCYSCCLNVLTHYSIITPLMPLKYHVFENIMENGAFALLEQMLHFP